VKAGELALVAGAAVVLLACPPPKLPGDQSMGTWRVTADFESRSPGCALSELPMLDVDGGLPPPLTFEFVLTRDTGSTAAWMTLAGYSREGTFDGQYVTNIASAPRVFTECSQCQTRLIERLDFAVLSRSQAEALGGACPPNPLDFGVLPSPTADGGVTLPRQTVNGFDAVRLCGEMSNEVVADADAGECAPECTGCFITWTVRGERR
jgi:hypothetical protein